jgi:hypothetical protein
LDGGLKYLKKSEDLYKLIINENGGEIPNTEFINDFDKYLL